MTSDSERLLRYLDGEMSALEAQRFRARLAETPALRQKLAEMQRVGEFVRLWASRAEGRAGNILEPTLARVAREEKRSARMFSLAFAVTLVLIALSPWSRPPGLVQPPGLVEHTPLRERAGRVGSAAIERIDSGAQQATVFVVGTNATPVVWLSDDLEQGVLPVAPGPG